MLDYHHYFFLARFPVLTLIIPSYQFLNELFSTKFDKGEEDRGQEVKVLSTHQIMFELAPPKTLKKVWGKLA